MMMSSLLLWEPATNPKLISIYRQWSQYRTVHVSSDIYVEINIHCLSTQGRHKIHFTWLREKAPFSYSFSAKTDKKNLQKYYSFLLFCFNLIILISFSPPSSFLSFLFSSIIPPSKQKQNQNQRLFPHVSFNSLPPSSTCHFLCVMVN